MSLLRIKRVRDDVSLFFSSPWEMIRNNDFETFKLKFEKCRMKSDTKNSKKETLLSFAAKLDRPRFVEFLISQTADINSVARAGQTPVHNSVYPGSTDCLDLLLNWTGLKIDTKTKEGYTPLHAAVFHGNLAAFEKLLDRGADPNTADRHGNTLFKTAIDHNDPKASHFVQKILPRMNNTPEEREKMFRYALSNNCPRSAWLVMMATSELRTKEAIKAVMMCAINVDDDDIIKTVHQNYKSIFVQINKTACTEVKSCSAAKIMNYMIKQGYMSHKYEYISSYGETICTMIPKEQCAQKIFLGEEGGRECLVCGHLDDGREDEHRIQVLNPCGHTCCKSCVGELNGLCPTCPKAFISTTTIMFPEFEEPVHPMDTRVDETVSFSKTVASLPQFLF